MDPSPTKPSKDLVVRLVRLLYKAMDAGDVKRSASILADELDWWFHGPPLQQQHLMRMLTGIDRLGTFLFVPLRLHGVDAEQVVAEGRGRAAAGDDFYWIHIWTVKNGRVTHLREYCNTSVTVASSSKTPSRSFGAQQLPGLVLAV